MKTKEQEVPIATLDTLRVELHRLAVAEARMRSAPRRRRRLFIAGLIALVVVPSGGLAVAELANQIDPDNDGQLDQHDLNLLDRNGDSIITGDEAAAKTGGTNPLWLRQLRGARLSDAEQQRMLERAERLARADE